YGAIIGSQMAKTMCGLRTDEHLQVMREDGSLIEGLYANATTAGGLSGEANYGCFWNSTVFGGVGTSWITGWIAAKSLLDAQ
ncbi:MAG: FAD-binding protein, partial [Eggerthella lenta]|nr:FAD-binding protein [Eggerthella lenta]